MHSTQFIISYSLNIINTDSPINHKTHVYLTIYYSKQCFLSQQVFRDVFANYMFLFIALNRGDCARWFNFTDKSIANHFLLCNPCCIWKTTAYFTLDKLLYCCLTTYSPDIRIKPVWDSQSELIVNLHIEYTSGFGKSDLLLGTRGTFYDVIHKKGYLTKFPDNICEFQDIVKVDLSEKEIDSLIGIHCLFLLDTLILKGNSMEMIVRFLLYHFCDMLIYQKIK